VVLAHVFRDFILPNGLLRGLLHVSARPIDKFKLLQLIAEAYGKVIDIQPDDSVEINRSLDGSLFSKATGFTAPEWPELIEIMFNNR
jgi:dTDP-4-dehydrorhamnose reductase